MATPAPLPLDAETKAFESPLHHKDELRLWLRLLACTALGEAKIRSRLRRHFDTTLPRFDLLAQLERVPEGMTLGELSKRMMVSNGNTTGLVERMVESGMVSRAPLANDRRVQIVTLTPAGRSAFREMAIEHEIWMADLFGGLSGKEIGDLLKLLNKLKLSLSRSAE